MVYGRGTARIVLSGIVEEKYLKTIGVGTLCLTEDQSEKEVDNEIRSIISKLPNTDKDLVLSTKYVFLRRDGRKKAFTVHIHGDNYCYDAMSLKELKTKDSKYIYIFCSDGVSKNSQDASSSRIRCELPKAPGFPDLFRKNAQSDSESDTSSFDSSDENTLNVTNSVSLNNFLIDV